MEEEKRKLEHEIEKKDKEITFEKIISFFNGKKKKVIDGFEDGFKLALILKDFESLIKNIKEEIKETVINEIADGYEWGGFRFEKTASGRYDYSESLTWNDLNEKRKALEKDMQYSFKSGKIMFCEETGEGIESAIFKPNKISYKISKIK